MMRPLLWLPLAFFALIAGVAAFGLLRSNDRTIHSAMVGKTLPPFDLPPILPGKPGVARSSFTDGKPRLLNVFASWCLPCAAEAPQLLKLRDMGVEIDAIAIRDTPAALRQFIARNGDPFTRIGHDPDSSVQLALGSSGVPESFIIDGHGRIVLQHIGEIRPEDVPDMLATAKGAK